MKRFLVPLMALLLLVVPAMAEEQPVEILEDSMVETPVDPVAIDTTTTKEEDGVIVNVTIAQPETPQEPSAGDSSEVDVVPLENSPTMQTFSVSSPDILAPGIPADGSTAMADVVKAVLGEYHRQTYTVTQHDAQGNVIATSTEFVPGLAGLDYPWIAGATLFALFLCGFLRLIGGLLRR